MTTLYRVMAIPLFFEEQGFSPVTLSLEHTEDAFGKARTNAVFTLQTDIPLPVSLSLHGSGTVFKKLLPRRQGTDCAAAPAGL